MSQVTITDKDREAAHALRRHECSHGYRSWASCNDCIAAFIAQAREEVRAETVRSIMDNPDHSPDSLAFKLREQGREEGRRKEREACAKVCEAFDASGAPGAEISTWGEGVADGAEYAKAGCAAAIRARREV